MTEKEKEQKYYKIGKAGIITGIVVWVIVGAVKLWLS